MRIRVLRLSVVLVAALVMLTGCFGSDSDQVAQNKVPNSKIFSVDEFDIEYPRDWRVLTRNDFPSEVPKETKLVFQQNVKGEFIVNVNIGQVTLSEAMSSLDYSKKVIQEQRNGLINFEEVKREEIQLSVGESLQDAVIITFIGKNSPEAIERKFVQTHLVKDSFAYTVTGAMRTNEPENIVQLVEGMLKSFKLK